MWGLSSEWHVVTDQRCDEDISDGKWQILDSSSQILKHEEKMITQALIKARRFIRILKKTTVILCNLLLENVAGNIIRQNSQTANKLWEQIQTIMEVFSPRIMLTLTNSPITIINFYGYHPGGVEKSPIQNTSHINTCSLGIRRTKSVDEESIKHRLPSLWKW